MLNIEHVDFIRVFLLYSQKRNDGQNLVPKMGIYLHIRYLRIYAHAQSWTFCGYTKNSYYLNERSYEKHIGYAEHPMSEFLPPYAEKKSAPLLLGICASTHMTSSGVSADIRRLSDAGVSATVCRYSNYG